MSRYTDSFRARLRENLLHRPTVRGRGRRMQSLTSQEVMFAKCLEFLVFRNYIQYVMQPFKCAM